MTSVTIERHDPEAGIKVVPIFIEGEHEQPEAAQPAVERVRGPLLGLVALAFATLTVVLLAAAIIIATGGDYGLSTTLAYGAIGSSVLAVLAGLVAAILGFGRRWGVIALVVGVLADPVVLLGILRFASGLQAG